MSHLWSEGFEKMGDDVDSSATIQALLETRYPGGTLVNGNGVRLVAAEAADGSFALQWGTTTAGESNSFQIPLGDQAGNTLIVGMRIKLSSSVISDYTIFTLRGIIVVTITDQLSVQVQNNADILLVRGFTTIGTATSVLTAGSDHYIELVAEVGNSATAKVYVDGVLEIDFSGDTQNGSTNAVDELEINGIESESAGDYGSTDDIYCFNTLGSFNNSRLGPSAIVRGYLATSDASLSDWTTSSGVDHFALVDEDPEGASDYNSSDTPGDIDYFNMAVISGDDIDCITVEMIGQADAPGVAGIRAKVKSGASTGNGARQALTDINDPVVRREAYETDPSTSALWTVSGANAAEFGVERVS
jgi:hypothetical protein